MESYAQQQQHLNHDRPSLGLEIEEPPVRDTGTGQQSRCFPCKPFGCCPSAVTSFIPGTWQNIQDSTHCILVCGVLSCLGLVVQTAFVLFNLHCWSLFCNREIFVVVFILPFFTYCVRTISQYDDRLVAKQQQAKMQKENLTRCYNSLISDMDGLLTKSAESSAGLAERSFESKRRDFQRFLERVKQRDSSLKNTYSGDYGRLLEQFRRFCINWLRVFEECSIDPTQNPKRVVDAEEINRCISILAVADLCLDRLRITEVRFISIQRDKDQQMIRKQKNQVLSLRDQESDRLGLAAREVTEPQDRHRSKISWIQIGRYGCKCTCSNPETQEAFPKSCSFGCVKVIVLSREHLMLLAGVVIGTATMGMEVCGFVGFFEEELKDEAARSMNRIGVSMVLMSLVCLLVMLFRFEDIDILQQLEREVKQLANQNKQVEKQRENMKEFWHSCQQLTELWLYRTVPRLDLYKEVHSHLEDSPQDDLLQSISGANLQLEDLEQKLGDLEAWRKDGRIRSEDKKHFGKLVNTLCQEQDFPKMLNNLEEISATGMKALHCSAFPVRSSSFSPIRGAASP